MYTILNFAVLIVDLNEIVIINVSGLKRKLRQLAKNIFILPLQQLLPPLLLNTLSLAFSYWLVWAASYWLFVWCRDYSVDKFVQHHNSTPSYYYIIVKQSYIVMNIIIF